MEKFIKNMSSAMVSISLPNVNFRCDLRPGQSYPLSEAVLNDMQYEPGCSELIDGGVIQIFDNTPAKRNVKEIVKSTPDDRFILSKEEVASLLQDEDISQFTKVIQKASPVTLETIGNVAIELNISDPAHTTLIKKYCKLDVLSALAAKQNEQ